MSSATASPKRSRTSVHTPARWEPVQTTFTKAEIARFTCDVEAFAGPWHIATGNRIADTHGNAFATLSGSTRETHLRGVAAVALDQFDEAAQRRGRLLVVAPQMFGLLRLLRNAPGTPPHAVAAIDDAFRLIDSPAV